jgi:hypothetical protein
MASTERASIAAGRAGFEDLSVVFRRAGGMPTQRKRPANRRPFSKNI